MKRVIKNQKKMKNAMYIVFGAFALALFAITRINPSYADNGLMIDDALDAIVLYGEVETATEDEEVEEVQDEEAQEIEQAQEVEEDEDVVEQEETTDEEINKEYEASEDLDEIVLERDNKEIDKVENKEENHGVSDENMDNEKGKEEQKQEEKVEKEEIINENKEEKVETSEEFGFRVPENKITEEVQPDIIESVEIYGTGEYEGVKVEVYAQTGLFESGTILTIEPVIEGKLEQVKEVLSGEVEMLEEEQTVVAFDITFRDPVTQEELQPKNGTVQVTFNYEENENLVQAEENEEQEVKVYHLNDIDEDGNKIEELTGTTVEEVVVNKEESEDENVLVVEAGSFSVYTIVVQVKEEQLINFSYGIISIANPSNPSQGITIMDRNLGATTTGAWGNAPSGSYGYYYQWGNNYGFDSSKNSSQLSTSSTKVDVSGLTEYSSSTFITYNSSWMSGTNNDSLWNGESNQGPCPKGWHVPTSSEWSQLYDYYKGTYTNSGVSDFSDYFNIPLAGYLSIYASSYSKGTYGYYWSSTPYSNGDDNILNFYLYLYSSSVNKTNSSGRGNGYSMRCFKDSYVGNLSIHNVEFDLKGGIGSTTTINVQNGSTLDIPSIPTRNNSIFSGWYLSGTDAEFDFTGTIITQDISLYAKWNCEMGYENKGNSCVRKPNGKTATLLSGQSFNITIKKMAKPSISSYSTQDGLIKKIKNIDVIPEGVEILALQKISTTDSEYPVYAWYDSGSFTLYYYTEAGTIYMNEDSSYMFYGLEKLESLDLNNFDTSNVTNMNHMFYTCNNLASFDLGNFNTSKVTNMNGMFGWTKAETLDLSNFDTSNVTNMSHMFHYSKLTSLDLSNFDTSNVTDMSSMFESSDNLTSLDLSNFDTSNVTDMSSMFELMRGLISLDLSSFDTKNVTDMHNMFRQCIKLQNLQFGSKFKADKATNMYGMFNSCGATRLDLSSFDTKNATNMGNMFYNCDNLVSLDLSSFDTKNVTDMNCMFESSDSIEEIIFGDNFDTSKVTDMNYMFGYCPKLTSLDLSNFDTSNVTNMHHMFQGDSSLTELDLSNFNTSKVTNMYGMFDGCSSLSKLDVSNFDTSKISSMGSMFSCVNNLTELDLTSFDTSNVTNMDYTFTSNYCWNDKKLKTIYVGENFKTDKVTSSTKMFTDQTLLVGGNGTIYNSSYIDKTYARIDNAPDEPGYFTHGIRLNFDSMSGTTVKSQTIKKGLTGYKPNNPTRTGYMFSGWYEDGAVDVFDFTGTEMIQNKILYAKWNANTYTVSFNADNGEVNPGNITVTYDSQYPGLPVVNKTGYTFSGWYSGEEMVSSGDIVKITEDVTLKAKRNINKYKIIFDTDGGNEINPIEKDYNSLLTSLTLPIPTKECNDFSRWDVELPETMPAHDITLKAIWNYTCSRSSGGGGGAKKSESTTREIAIDTSTEQEHNSANEEQKSDIPETSNTPANEETTSNQVISVTQEVSEDGTIEAVVETIKIKNTDIVATVRTEVASSTTSNSSSVNHTREENDAYSFAKSNGITTTSSIDDAKMNTELTRIQMAKMLSNFAINVLGQEPDPEKGIVKFDDVTNKMDKQYDNAVTKAYQLGIMGQNMKNNEFRPSDTVTRAEFASALSRLLYHTEEGNYKGTGKYYIPHVAKLYNEGIINKTDPKIKEKRGYVMTMLMRTVQ